MILEGKRRKQVKTMAIDKYVCPTFEEEGEPEQLIRRTLDSHHKGEYEREFFKGLLGIINDLPLRVALIEGVVKGTPLDPSPDNPLSQKLNWVAFHPQWGKEWEVLRHTGYMLLPYNARLETVTPFLSVEFHTRRYIGNGSDFIKQGKVQTINRIRYDQGRTQSLLLSYDPQGAEQRRKQRIRSGRFDSDDQREKVLDNFEVDRLNAPQLGPAPLNPSGVSSVLTRNARYKIWEFINIKSNRFPERWGEADFYELGCSFMRKAVGLPQTDENDLDMMTGFYSNGEISFVNITELKKMHLPN